jgi:hypothetical protein
MLLGSKPLTPHDIDPVEGLEEICKLDPSSAQLRLWHAQRQHDEGVLSGKELAVVERIAGQTAGRSRTIFNPYTGEIRKVMLPDWVGKHKDEDAPIVGWSATKG